MFNCLERDVTSSCIPSGISYKGASPHYVRGGDLPLEIFKKFKMKTFSRFAGEGDLQFSPEGFLR